MSKIEALVSVIMPAYNSGQFIKESIESIINQSYPNWELIVIDDGSTDNTASIIQQFAQEKRIKIVTHEENKGLVASRNQGIISANGKYIANLDSDDIALPNRLKKQVEFMEENPEYVLLGSACVNIDTTGKKIESIKRNIPNEHLKSLLVFSNYFINSTAMMRADSAKSVHHQEEIPLAEDYFFFTELSKKGKVGNLNDELVEYRIHESNISKLKKEELLKAMENIQKGLINQFEIEQSPKELSIHSSLINGNAVELGFKLEEVELWLKKLVFANQKKKIYPIAIFNHYCSFFYRRTCQNSRKGIKAFNKFNKSELSSYLKGDLIGKSIFFVKSILNR